MLFGLHIFYLIIKVRYVVSPTLTMAHPRSATLSMGECLRSMKIDKVQISPAYHRAVNLQFRLVLPFV